MKVWLPKSVRGAQLIQFVFCHSAGGIFCAQLSILEDVVQPHGIEYDMRVIDAGVSSKHRSSGEDCVLALN